MGSNTIEKIPVYNSVSSEYLCLGPPDPEIYIGWTRDPDHDTAEAYSRAGGGLPGQLPQEFENSTEKRGGKWEYGGRNWESCDFFPQILGIFINAPPPWL